MINAKMKIVATRLQDGQDLMKEIQKLAEDHSIQAGVVLSAVGSLKTSNIRVPILNGKIKYIYPKNLEIDNLHGTVSINGCHLHITVSDTKGNVMGGHLKENCIIRTTCELVVGVIEDKIFKRELDTQTSFEELVIE
jgi:predicted DNA-binding protein with PD1-like motif